MCSGSMHLSRMPTEKVFRLGEQENRGKLSWSIGLAELFAVSYPSILSNGEDRSGRSRTYRKIRGGRESRKKLRLTLAGLRQMLYDNDRLLHTEVEGGLQK